MTWIITATGNENEISIECHATDTNVQQVIADPPIAYTPDVFPMGFTGNIVSTSRLVTPMGEFNFTNDNITGTWDFTDNLLYSQREYTQTNALKLTKNGSSTGMTRQTITPTTITQTTITPITITPTTITPSTTTPFNTGFASLLATQAEYNRLVAVFDNWGFNFDELYARYSDEGFAGNWAFFWIGSATDETRRVTFDRVGNQWKPRNIP